MIFHYSHSIYISLIFFVYLKFIQPGPRLMRPTPPQDVESVKSWPEEATIGQRHGLFSIQNGRIFTRNCMFWGVQICFWCVLEQAGMSKKTLTFSEQANIKDCHPQLLGLFSRSIHQQTPPKEVRFACLETLFENLIESLGINSKTHWTYSEI